MPLPARVRSASEKDGIENRETKKRRWERPAPLFNLRAGAAFATAQKIVENAQYNVPEITIAAGKVST